MIDGLDGFELTPSPAAVRNLRTLAVALVLGSVFIVVVFGVLAISKGDPVWWLAIGIYLVLSVPADWVLWRVMRPPVLRADGMTVTYKTGFQTFAIPRSDLTLIYLGQVVQRARYTAWVQSYVFAVSNGNVMFSVPSLWFRTEDIRAFGDRLNVPVRGDFTQRVQGTVSERP